MRSGSDRGTLVVTMHPLPTGCIRTSDAERRWYRATVGPLPRGERRVLLLMDEGLGEGLYTAFGGATVYVP